MVRWLRRSLPWLPFALVAFGPALYLICRTCFPEGGEFSLSAYAPIFGGDAMAAARRSTLWNSLLLAGSIVAAALAVGVPFGFLVARTDLRLRRFYESLAIVPLLLPPYLSGIAWVQIHPMRGLPAIVFILAGALWPVAALLSARAFRDIGADVEDAARLALGERRALARVTLPLARGGIAAGALLVFVFALSDFVVPDFFSFSVQNETTFQVFATEIYGAFLRQRDPIGAAAFAVPLVAIAGVALALLARSAAKRSVASLCGSHVAPRPFQLGRGAIAGHLFAVALLGTTIGVPLGVLGGMATKSAPSVPTAPVVSTPASPTSAGVPAPSLGSFDYSVYRQRSPVKAALETYVPAALHSLRDAVVGVLLMLLLAWGPARALARSASGSAAAHAVVLLPLAFPSLLLGMAHEQLFLADAGLADRIYRGWGLVSLTFASRFLPLAVVGLAASWRRIAPEIEEATELAPISGARRLLSLRLPLLLPALLAVGTLGFGLMMREFDAIVLLPGAQEMLTHRIYNLVHQARDAVVGALSWLQVASVLVPWLALRLLLPAARR
ncbi:MAG: iron ABC transporter permease [Planctomycetes bacterium]|nr:iron ABC transporter permease [Planctomycetota bacterium]